MQEAYVEEAPRARFGNQTLSLKDSRPQDHTTLPLTAQRAVDSPVCDNVADYRYVLIADIVERMTRKPFWSDTSSDEKSIANTTWASERYFDALTLLREGDKLIAAQEGKFGP